MLEADQAESRDWTDDVPRGMGDVASFQKTVLENGSKHEMVHPGVEMLPEVSLLFDLSWV